MRTFLALLLFFAALGTASASGRYIHVSGYAFKTDPQCHRTKPIDQFDARCDEPVLGYRDFCPPLWLAGLT
ncbi:hypothetical protein ASC97_21315 [Rhizobium sp. Root1203]|jgi:hypothetical protein|nr:hypothetical protein ASC97_21315 [Rhizobium sp. Root1203]